MSEHLNSLNSPIQTEVVEQIERLNLSTLQKLHLKLLIHCLEIFKNIASQSDNNFPNAKLIEDWCSVESKKLNDENFSPLLFQQMDAASKKLKDHAKNISKNPLDLNLDDLITLVSPSS